MFFRCKHFIKIIIYITHFYKMTTESSKYLGIRSLHFDDDIESDLSTSIRSLHDTVSERINKTILLVDDSPPVCNKHFLQC